MYVDSKEGINIENGTKHKCSKCKSIVAITDNDGKFLLRKVTIIYISLKEKICEIKCKDCGSANSVNIFP